MKKDILVPNSTKLHLAIVPVAEDAWDLYLINLNPMSIRNILIVTEAVAEDKKSSTLRYFLETMTELSCIKFETIYGEVMSLHNTAMITYYKGVDFYDISFHFSQAILRDMNQIAIPVLQLDGFYFEK